MSVKQAMLFSSKHEKRFYYDSTITFSSAEFYLISILIGIGVIHSGTFQMFVYETAFLPFDSDSIPTVKAADRIIIKSMIPIHSQKILKPVQRLVSFLSLFHQHDIEIQLASCPEVV